MGAKRKPSTVAVSSSGVCGVRLRKGADAGKKSSKKRDCAAAGSSSAVGAAGADVAEAAPKAVKRTITRAVRKRLEGCKDGDQNRPEGASFK